MRLPRFWLAIAALFVTVPAHADPVASPDPAATAYARQIVDIVLPPDRRADIVTEMMRTLGNQMRGAIMDQLNDAGLRQIIDGYLAKMPDRLRPAVERYMPVLMDAMVQAYAREFSIEELRQVAGFATTPTGRHYFSRSSAIMSDPGVGAANRAFYADAQQVAQASQIELRQMVTDYLTKHPEVARKMLQERKTPDATP